MNALLQDRNWLKIFGIVVVLTTTVLVSQGSQGFIYRAQVNAPLLVQSACLNQVHTYKERGRFLPTVAGPGDFTNPYPEFYTHSTQFANEKVWYYATSRSPHLKSYVGLVMSVPGAIRSSTNNGALSAQKHAAIAIVCEATQPGTTPANAPSFDGSTLTCSSQTRQVSDIIRAQ